MKLYINGEEVIDSENIKIEVSSSEPDICNVTSNKNGRLDTVDFMVDDNFTLELRKD